MIQVTIDVENPWCVSCYDACQVTMKQALEPEWTMGQ